MMSVNWMIVIFSLLWNCSQACNPNETCFIDTSNGNIKNLLASMDYFSTQLIQTLLYNENVFMNVVISPMSIYVVLALVLFGSAGDTQKELIEALHFPNADLQQLRIDFGNILIATEVKRGEMVNGKEDIALKGHAAEGFFIQKDLTLVNEYSAYLNALNIKIQSVDFMQDASMAINQWITDNKPKSNSASSAEPSFENTKIFLTSLFYFTAKWEDNIFLDKAPGLVPFHSMDGGITDVEMMKTSRSLFHYDNGSSYAGVEILYEGYDFSAVFLLPHPEVDAINFVTTFTMDILTEFLSKGEMKDVDCQIPKLSYSYSISLKEQLQEWGINQLFEEADLSNMFNMQKQDFVLQMAHVCDINVSEKGAMADFLTVEPVKKTPPTTNLTPFIADRPFLMLIRSTNSYGIAFATFFFNASNTVFVSSP